MDPEPNISEPTIEALLDCTAALTADERLRVQRFWNSVIWSELSAGAREAATSVPTSWLSMSEDEKADIRSRRRPSTGRTLRLVHGDGQAASEVGGGEAA